MSAIAELRTATWSAHQRLEKRIGFKARLETFGAYRAYLESMWGFYAAIEPGLISGDLREWLPDCEVRRKVPLLERDLVALGAPSSCLELLPRCQSVPASDDAASAFGCAYVLEGATLGGRSLLPLVETRLGLRPECGAAFLASYGEAVQARWQSFGEALERCCAAERQRVRAAATARATFSALERWLCGAEA
jgi:heme oxygenase (biliverdin-IX-beta and delta-forming)